jgi:hypothetical protein
MRIRALLIFLLGVATSACDPATIHKHQPTLLDGSRGCANQGSDFSTTQGTHEAMRILFRSNAQRGIPHDVPLLLQSGPCNARTGADHARRFDLEQRRPKRSRKRGIADAHFSQHERRLLSRRGLAARRGPSGRRCWVRLKRHLQSKKQDMSRCNQNSRIQAFGQIKNGMVDNDADSLSKNPSPKARALY